VAFLESSEGGTTVVEKPQRQPYAGGRNFTQPQGAYNAAADVQITNTLSSNFKKATADGYI
jgi:hypothetical protein